MDHLNLSLILTFLMVYDKLINSEELYKNFPSFSNKLNYVEVFSTYESVMGTILLEMGPEEVFNLMKKIAELCVDGEKNIKKVMNIKGFD